MLDWWTTHAYSSAVYGSHGGRPLPPRGLALALLRGVVAEGSPVGLLRLMQGTHGSNAGTRASRHHEKDDSDNLLELSPGDIRGAACDLVAGMLPRGSEEAAAGGLAAALVGVARPAIEAPTDDTTAAAALAAAWASDGTRLGAEVGPGGGIPTPWVSALVTSASARGAAEVTAEEASAVGMEGEPTPRATPVYASDPESGGAGGGWASGLGWPGVRRQ